MDKIIEKQFTQIYNSNKNADDETVSGIGSKIENTKELLNQIPQILKEYNISSVFDIGCGDFNWMRKIDLSGINYTGGEIVAEVVCANKKYESKNITFKSFDITSDEIPTFDLIIVRGVLSFYNTKTVKSIINKIISSNSKYILLTNFTDSNKTKVNFLNSPYNFPQPIKNINDGLVKHLSLWKIVDLPIQVTP
jgi:hypothetical protein